MASSQPGLPLRREGAETMRRVLRPARLSLRWFNPASVTSRRTPSRCSPVAKVRRRSCSHHPETPDAVSSADLAFDQPPDLRWRALRIISDEPVTWEVPTPKRFFGFLSLHVVI